MANKAFKQYRIITPDGYHHFCVPAWSREDESRFKFLSRLKAMKEARKKRNVK